MQEKRPFTLHRYHWANEASCDLYTFDYNFPVRGDGGLLLLYDPSDPLTLYLYIIKYFLSHKKIKTRMQKLSIFPSQRLHIMQLS